MRVELTRKAEKQLLDLPGHVQRRFRTAIARLAQDWPIVRGTVDRLEGHEGLWRVRIGAYRGVFEGTTEALVFTRFGHRSTVYR